MSESISESPYLQPESTLEKSQNPEADLMKEVEGRVYISLDEFYELLEKAGLDRNLHKSGTYLQKKEGGVYVYVKRDFIAPTLERAQEKLHLCEELTKRGALFPGTRWSIFQRPSGQFHVFAVTRKLDLVLPSEDRFRNSRILRERLGSAYAYTIDPGEANSNPMGHLPGSTDLYPVDIEVIGLGFDEHEAIEREIAFQNKSRIDTVEEL